MVIFMHGIYAFQGLYICFLFYLFLLGSKTMFLLCPTEVFIIYTIGINNLYMEFSDKELFNIKSLKIYSQDKIGIVGSNGAGKTTLMEIIAGRMKPVSGYVEIYGAFCYIPQLKDYDNQSITNEQLKRWCVPQVPKSGGELTRMKIAGALSKSSQILLCDEPSSKLDLLGIEKLEEVLIKYDGTIIIISHDRALLDKVCNKIWEIDDGIFKTYQGNYTDYRRQKELKEKRQQEEYDSYITEKKHLENALQNRSLKAKSMTRTPSRMGNSEARLHRQNVRQKAGKVEQASKQIKKRLQRLEIKDKPKEYINIKISTNIAEKYISKNAITINNLTFSYSSDVILDDISLTVSRGDKVAITGDNGSGKSTLLNCISNKTTGAKIAPGAEIGYFRQNYSNLNQNNTILQCVKKNSAVPEYMVRIILGRLGIRRQDVFKKIKVLSGGELCKVSLASLICSRYPILLLDEPTNYLDIYVLEALEDMLYEFDGTLIFVSHDRYFREKIATREFMIKNNNIFEIDKNKPKKSNDSERLLLELKKVDLISRLAYLKQGDDIEELEQKYEEVCVLMNEFDSR